MLTSGVQFLIWAGALVFVMHGGFAMLCAGAIRAKNTMNILLQTILDAAVSAIMFYLVRVLGHAAGAVTQVQQIQSHSNCLCGRACSCKLFDQTILLLGFWQGCARTFTPVQHKCNASLPAGGLRFCLWIWQQRRHQQRIVTFHRR